MMSCEHWTFAEISEATYRLESCEMQWCNNCCTSHVLRVRISLMILCTLPSFWRWGCCLSCFGVLSDLVPWLKDGILWLQSVRQRWRSCQKVNCGISKGSSHRSREVWPYYTSWNTISCLEILNQVWERKVAQFLTMGCCCLHCSSLLGGPANPWC